MATLGDKAKGLVEKFYQSYWRPPLFNLGLGALLCVNAYFIQNAATQNFAFWGSGTCFGYCLFQLLFPFKRAEFSEIERAQIEKQLRDMFFKQFEEAKRMGWVAPDAKADLGWKQ